MWRIRERGSVEAVAFLARPRSIRERGSRTAALAWPRSIKERVWQ